MENKVKLLSVKETTFKYEHNNYEGVIITLEGGIEIKIGIDDDQQCCEKTGFLSSNDDYSDFIGAEFLTVLTVDTNNLVSKLKDIYESDVAFINVETSKGTLQFAVYNEHNGYYGHDVIVLNGADKVDQFSL
jgi:hypothetical protein